MTEVTVHPAAELEYEAALWWDLERSPQAAQRFETAFHNALDAIQANPGLYPTFDAIH